MRRFFAVMLCPLSCWAGPYDYYHCTGPDGQVAYSVDPCQKNEIQLKLTDPGHRNSLPARSEEPRSGPAKTFVEARKSQMVWLAAKAPDKPKTVAAKPDADSPSLKLTDLCAMANSGQGLPMQYAGLVQTACPALYKNK